MVRVTIRNKVKKQEHAKQVIKLLKKYYPNPKCALNFSNPLELLIATVLSAQCTDQRVNIVTEKLFKKYTCAEDYAQADLSNLEEDIHSTGFYKNKAKNIKNCGQRLVEIYNSEVPKTLDDLVTLGGVGRKTANVVLGNAFNIASGVVVDTHVTRLSNRLSWVKGRNAVVLERELNEIIDKKNWIILPHLLINHGRAICKARKPLCETCFLNEICPKKPY